MASSSSPSSSTPPSQSQALPALPFSPARLRSYILRIPLFTRLAVGIIVAFWVLCLIPWLGVREWGFLTPGAVRLLTLHRLNTYVFIHNGLLHMTLNVLALTPLLERFESEHGTLTTLLTFLGPFSTIPAGLYLLIEGGILRGTTGVVGASVWVFLLLGAEAIKTYKINPHFALGPYRIPTWTTPLVAILLVPLLFANTSFLGHLCGVAVGYAYGLGYLKFLVPPEKLLRYVEEKLDLLSRLPHFVSIDQKTYGRYGILPMLNVPAPAGGGQRLGP